MSEQCSLTSSQLFCRVILVIKLELKLVISFHQINYSRRFSIFVICFNEDSLGTYCLMQSFSWSGLLYRGDAPAGGAGVSIVPQHGTLLLPPTLTFLVQRYTDTQIYSQLGEGDSQHCSTQEFQSIFSNSSKLRETQWWLDLVCFLGFQMQNSTDWWRLEWKAESPCWDNKNNRGERE